MKWRTAKQRISYIDVLRHLVRYKSYITYKEAVIQSLQDFLREFLSDTDFLVFYSIALTTRLC